MDVLLPVRALGVAAALAAPMVAAAALEPGNRTDLGLFGILGRLDFALGFLLPLAISLGVLAFFWGMARFIYNSDNEVGREQGRTFMIWSVIALFVMISIWGIISLIGAELGIGRSGKCPPPSINGQVTETCATAK